MIAVYGIGLLIILSLSLILVWKLGSFGFIFLILGLVFLMTQKNK